jgi:aldehyde oxidoreductase
MLTQLAAHVLDLPMEKINLYTCDTDKTVAAGPSAGSHMTYVNGGALVNALEKMAKAMKEAGSKNYIGLKKAGKPRPQDRAGHLFRFPGAQHPDSGNRGQH